MNKKTNKKGAGAKAPAPAKTPAKKIPTSVYVVAAAIVVAAIIIAIAVVIVNDNKSRARDMEFVQAQQEPMDVAKASIRLLLDNDGTGVAKVFDIEGNQLFLLRDTQGIAPVGTIPTELKEKLWAEVSGGQSPRKIDLDAWSNSRTILGGNNTELKELISGSFGWYAAVCWSDYSGYQLGDEQRLVVAAALDESFTTEELFDYIMASARFGNNRGLTSACENWFGKTLSQINVQQQDYLVYALSNVNANWDDFQSTHGDATGGAESAEAFGFTDGGDPYWLLRRAVQAELVEALGTEQLTGEYNVRLKINPRIQSDVQNAINNGMAGSISLTSTGQTVLDGTAMVVDTHTGYVVALVGGRSRNTIANQLTFNATSNIGVYETARSILASDEELTFASLLSYDTLSGQTEWGTFGGIVASGQISLLGATPVLESTVTLEEIAEFMTSLYLNEGPRFIEQIQTADGKSVYTAKVVLDVSDMNSNPDLRCLIVGDPEANYVDYQQNVNDGIAVASASSEFIAVGLYGTSAQGYTLSDSDYNMCLSTAYNVLNTAVKHFPMEPSTIDPEGKVAAKVEKSQEQNTEFIVQLIDGWAEELKAMPINSTDSREEFESAYSYYVSMAQTYVGVVSDDTLMEQIDKLTAVRGDRSEELLKYAS